MDVIVIGGGVIGLCLAEAIVKLGASVTIVEAEVCGGQASAGNSGWITPGFSVPVPAPGTVGQALRWMVNPASPLLVRPSWRRSDLSWAFRFWRSTTPGRYGAGVAALTALNQHTLGAFDELRAGGVEFEEHRDGLLLPALGEAALEKELTALRQQQALGYPGSISILDRRQALELEPTLGAAVVGGIFAADERHVRPESLTAGLRRRLDELGVVVAEGMSVLRIESDGEGWAAVVDGGGKRLVADRVVLTAGSKTARLLGPLGIHLPLVGGKGYSITEREPAVRPRRPLLLLERKVGVTPMSQGVRLAGTMELGAEDLRLRPRRIEALDRAAAQYLRGWKSTPTGTGTRVEWAGFRPLLPDGLPAIGPVPGRPGLFVATGHSMLGVTLAPATARVLAPTVLGDGEAGLLAPFSLARFGNLGEGMEG